MLLGLVPSQLFSLAITAPAFAVSTRGEALTEFFTQLFYHPGEHKLTIYVFAAIIIGTVALTAYLVKKVYEKHFPSES